MNWQLWPFWIKYMSFCAFAKLVTAFILFSAWDKSHVKFLGMYAEAYFVSHIDNYPDFRLFKTGTVHLVFLYLFSPKDSLCWPGVGVVKVRQSRKQIIVSSILPKKQTKLTILSKKKYKIVSFVQILEELMTPQIAFKIYWPLVV